MKAIISIVALAMTFASVLSQKLRGGPAVLSDVTTADASSVGLHKQPKTKYVLDILKENDKTKFVVQGHKHYPKTKVVAGTNKADFLNNVKGQPYDNGNDENCPVTYPCDDFGISFGDCMRSQGQDQDVIDGAIDCLVEAWDEVPVGTDCNTLSEVGFCGAVSACKSWSSDGSTSQKYPGYDQCTGEMYGLARCLLFHGGCNSMDYASEDVCWDVGS